jgi:Family of unknown function (DUF6279)
MAMKNLPFRRLPVVAVLAVVLSIAACTSSLIYNRLDTVARWYIGNLVTLDEAQQSALRDWLARTLAWHRDTELKRYEQFLQDLSAKVAAGPDAKVYPRAAQQAEDAVRELMGRIAPEAAALLTTLQPQQVDELLANLEERDAKELAEESGRDDAERQKRRVRSLTRSLERWTGSASSEQKAIIERTVSNMAAAHLLGDEVESAASRELWRAELQKALAQGASGKARLEALLTNPDQSYPASHRESQAAERQQFLDLVVELDATLSEKQRATFARKLNELAADLGTLARP